MTEIGNPYRRIVRSSSIVAGGSVLNVIIGVAKTKILAVLLGPVGVGGVGLLTNIMATASTLFGMGFGNVGTRQVAEAAARSDDTSVASARRALFWGTLVLSVLGSATIVVFRTPIAGWVLGDPSQSSSVGWLSIGVGLTIAAGSQTAILNGLRRIGDLVRVSVAGAIASAVVGVLAIWVFGHRGLLIFVISSPAAAFVFGHIFVARLSRGPRGVVDTTELLDQWRVLVKLGFAFMLAALVATASQLFVKAWVQRELGLEAVGFFQASFVISATYIAFVLRAMGADFYPLLSGLISDREQASRAVSDQTEMALLLAGPALLAMFAIAPWLISALYATSFAPAVSILRWQILGDLLKVASWPLGFVLLAAGDGPTFLFTEVLAGVTFAAVTIVMLPLMGADGAGVAYFSMYLLYLPLVVVTSRRHIGAWKKSVVRLFCGIAGALAVMALADHALDSLTVMIIGMCFTVAATLYSISCVNRLTGSFLNRTKLKAIATALFTRKR